ncbi:uncharacterized protein LOC111063613 [Nilaparvata lugens]|uniref:uncharacterized protein LOC111063613 n=1 Tax=Nilaparvata lugens TaxID=108931 RepID=UPI00193E6DF5|nr:uncharacterized protein LOC111063613 [Nilaparvata lugens]
MDFSVNTLISAVRKRPQLWDVEHKLYKGKQNKKEAWIQVCEEVFENFKERPRDEQLIIERLLITKWRSVRDGYVRTLKRQNSKVYFYRKQVQFLDKVLLAKEPKPEEPHTFWETIEAAEISQESDNHEVAASPDYNTLSADPLQLGTTVELGQLLNRITQQ